MDVIDAEKVRTIVRQVLEEMRISASSRVKRTGTKGENDGPKVLIVFHAGVSRLDEAMNQVRFIQGSAGKSSVFTDESARCWVCGDDVRKQAGARCILDTVKPEGLQKVMERSDVLILPTFCLKVGAKVANLLCDDDGSAIVCSALARGKKVLASRDGFLLTETLSNLRIREEMNRILQKLEEFGIMFAPTDQLAARFHELLQSRKTGNQPKEKAQASGTEPGKRIVTAKDISSAANEKKRSVHVIKTGIVTPLARDMAKEFGIDIVQKD